MCHCSLCQSNLPALPPEGEETLDVLGDAPPPPYLPQTVLSGGDVLVRLAELRAERDRARDDLRRALDRVEALVQHGLCWSPYYVVDQLRELREQMREDLR